MKPTSSLYICCFIFIILISRAPQSRAQKGSVYRSISPPGGVNYDYMNRLNKTVQTPGQNTEAASRDYSPPSPAR
ncbi:hypothetical protein K2173_017074 [Erythroxylum novogranatense]|uniref:Uncharacterized protein n=1 Tax=Erythroxylum novogranatense TaxID=1862640 RepID=A0AAV8U5T8_9ROSI|nr:hypothetical protein K2173_017074 [Erythroxylum novogranatense]